MLHSFKALLLVLFFCIFVIAEVEVSGTANEVSAIDVTDTEASLNIDATSEIEGSADVDQQGPAHGGAGNSGSRGGSAPPARAPPVQQQRPPPVQTQRAPPTQPHNVQAQPTRQPTREPTHVQPQPTQPRNNGGGGGSPFGGNNGNPRPPSSIQSRPPTVIPGAGQNPWNGGNVGAKPPTTIQSRPPTVVPGQGQKPPQTVTASNPGWPGRTPPSNVGATPNPGNGWPGRPSSSTVGATPNPGYGWPGKPSHSTVGATPGPGVGWPSNPNPGYGNGPRPPHPPATVTVHDPPPYGYNPGGYNPPVYYTSTRWIPYPTPGGSYGYNDPYGYPININLPPINLPAIIIDNPIWTIPFPGCSYVPVTTQSPTAIETGFTSTITQEPEFVTVYVGDDGYQTTYGNDPTTAYEVYMYTTTVYVDVVSKTRECWL